jgi:hypothetical protein
MLEGDKGRRKQERREGGKKGRREGGKEERRKGGKEESYIRVAVQGTSQESDSTPKHFIVTILLTPFEALNFRNSSFAR